MTDDLSDDPELAKMTDKEIALAWWENKLHWEQFSDPRVLRIVFLSSLPTADEATVNRFLDNMYEFIMNLFPKYNGSNMLSTNHPPHSLN